MANSWDPIVGTPPYEENLKRLSDIAKEKGYRLNPDTERLQKVVGLMTMNFMQASGYYCPCKQSHPLDVKTDTGCPCDTIDEEVAKEGNCFCKLFFK